MNFRIALASTALLGLCSTTARADTADPAKEALKAFNEFVGQWKGNGESKSGKTELWKETAEWAWDLKGAEPALKVKFDGGRQFSDGTLKYLPDKKKYQLKAKGPDKKEQVFTGEIKAKRLVLTHDDADTKDRYTIEMSTNNDGARFVYNVAVQKKGVGIARKLVEVGLSKEGAALAGAKKNECIITGGLGTMTVSYNGKTYYVCCSGCRDEFNANPKKYVEEYEKSKK